MADLAKHTLIGNEARSLGLKYRWLRNGLIIPNAYGATYQVRSQITVKVTGTLTGYTTASQESTGFFARCYPGSVLPG